MKVGAFLVVFALLFSVSPAGAAAAKGEPIKIGDITSFSKIPEYVTSYKNAAQLAVEEINEAGGIDGRPLEIVSIDAKGDPGTSVKAAEDLVAREKVSLLADCDLSSATLATSMWAKRHKVPLINACATADTIMWDYGHDYIFRTNTGSYMWISALADEVLKRYGNKIKGKRWAAVLTNYESGHAAFTMIKDLADERGLKADWVVEQWPPLGKLDAGPVVTALLNARPDVIFVYVYSSDLAKLVREGEKRGLFKNRIVIAPVAGWPENLELLRRETPLGWLTVGVPTDDIKEPGFVKFKEAYKERFDTPMRTFAQSGYDMVQAAAAALRKAGPEDRAKIRDALEVETFKTLFGPVSFRKIDHVANVPFWIGVTGVKDDHGALLESRMMRAVDYMPPDAWILERRVAKGKE